MKCITAAFLLFFSCERSEVVNHVDTSGLPDVEVILAGTALKEDVPTTNKTEGSFKCIRCEFRSKRKVLTRKHQFSHNIFQCLYCDDLFETFLKFESHGKIMHPKKPGLQTCSKCGFCIRLGETYQQHMNDCEGRQSVVCQHCGKGFKYEFRLKTHIQKQHSGVEGVLPQYPCEKCDFQAETRGALLRHELTHLDYACKHCSERFTSKASLREHLKIHADAKPYVCSECGRGFKCEFRLKDHKGCHSSERPFTCNIDDCILTFRTSAQCERHRRDVHNLRERPLVCEFGCGQRFYNTASLKRHQNTHHRSDQYFCEWEGCGKVFLHPDNLRVHSMQHTNEKPFSCELCDFTCRQKTSWQWHMTKKHPGEEYKSVPKRRVGIVKAMPQNSLVNMPPTTDSDKMSDHCNTNKSWMADGDPALPAQDDRDKLSIQSLDTAPAGCADTALVDDDATTADVNKAIDQVLAEQMADPIDDLNHLQAAEASEVFNNQDPGVLESSLSGDETSEVHVRPGTNDIDSPTTTMAMSYNNGNDSSRHSSFSNPTNALPDANVSKPEELATFGDENLTKTVPGTYPSSVGGHMESGYMDSQHQNCYSNTFSQMLPPQNNTILTPSTGQVHPDPSTLDSAVCDPIKALERISNSTVSSYKSHHMDMPYPKPNIESNYIKTDMEQSYMKPSMDNSSYPGTPVVSNPPAIPPYNSSEPVMSHPQYPPSVTVPTDPYAPHGDMAAYPTAPPSMMSHHYSHDTTNQQSLEGNTIKQHMISPHDASSNVSHPLVSPTTGNLDQRRNSTVSQEGPDNMYDIPPASNNSTKVSSVQSEHQSFDVPPPGVLPPSTAPPSAPPLTSAPLGVLPPSVLTSTTDPNTTTGHFSTTGTQSGGQVPAMGPAGAGPRSVGPPSVAPPSVDPPSAAPPNVGPPSAGPPNVAPPSAALPSVGPSSAGPPSVAPPSVGPPSAGPPSVAPPSVGHPSAAPPSVGPPTVAPPSVGPPSVAPPSVGPPSVAPPSVGPPSVAPPSVGPPSVAPPSVGPPSVAPPSVPPPSNVSTQEQSTYDMPPSNAISIDAPPTANSIQIVPQPDQASVDSGLATGDDNTPRTDTTVSSELVVPVSASKIDTFSSNTEISSLTDSSGYPNFYPSHMPSTGEPNMPSTNCFDSMLAHPSTTSSWQSATAGTITEKPVDNGAAVEESAEKQSEGGTLIPSTSLDNTTVPPTLLARTGYMPPDHSASLPDAPSYMGYSHPQDPLSGRSLDTYRSADYLRRGYPGSEILNSAGSQTGLGQQAWMGGSYSGALSQPPILPPSTDLSSSLSKEGYTSKEGYLTTPNSKDPSFLYDKDYSKRMGSGFPMPGREGMSMFNDPMSNPYGLTDWGRYSAGPNPPYARLPATSGKSYEDPYYRSLQPPAAPDVLSRMSMGPLGLDKYYYPRESMYRSNIMAPAGNPFMAQTPNPSADYRTQSMYSQQYPFMGSASHKFPQGVPPLPDRPMGSEYYGAPPPAPSTQDSRQDPYSRSMFYHMMNRF